MPVLRPFPDTTPLPETRIDYWPARDSCGYWPSLFGPARQRGAVTADDIGPVRLPEDAERLVAP